jgi:hypothetical protein
MEWFPFADFSVVDFVASFGFSSRQNGVHLSALIANVLDN